MKITFIGVGDMGSQDRRIWPRLVMMSVLVQRTG